MRADPHVLVPAVVASLVVLAGCAGGADVGETSSPAEPATSSSTAAPVRPSDAHGAPGASGTTAAPFDADAEPDTTDPSADARVTVRDVRVAAHDRYDRVVFEVRGTGTPGWDVRYVDQATEPGRGRAIELPGEGVLQVQITGAGYPYDTGVEEFTSSGPLAAPATEAVTEVAFAATFEGVTTAFIGTRDRAPFRVYALQDPERIVVEVVHPD